MSDEAAAALAGQGEQQQQDGDGQQQQQQQQQQAPAFLADVPEDLRGNADLMRMATVGDLAKGYVETRAWAKGRVAVPGADSDDTVWSEFGARLRPETADGYEIPVIEGQSDPGLIDRFKAFAHETGLPPRWAKSIAEFQNRETSDALSKLKSGNDADLKAIELELGGEAYNRRLEATANMLKAAGLEDFDAVTALQSALSTDAEGRPVPGAGKAMKLLFALAEKTGELGKVDPTDVSLRMGALSGEAAQSQIDTLMNDAAFMAKARTPGTAEAKKWSDLNAAVAAAAAAKAGR